MKELIHELGCVQYGNFKLTSGGYSNYKIFCDPLFENKEARDIIGETGYEFFRKIEGKYDIVGVVTGGFEFAKLVAERAGRNAVSVNPHNGETKGRPSKKPCYFEDAVTTGGTILKCRNILGESTGRDDRAVCIVDRLEGGRENLREKGIELESILTKNDLGITPKSIF